MKTADAKLARVRELLDQLPHGDACWACRSILAAILGPAPSGITCVHGTSEGLCRECWPDGKKTP